MSSAESDESHQSATTEIQEEVIEEIPEVEANADEQEETLELE